MGERKAADRGAYVLVLRLDQTRIVEIGRLGWFTFEAGYYLYAGSAMRSLSARIDRHLRRQKTLHWHIDYLLDVADTVRALPIRSPQRIEQSLARSLAGILTAGPNGFGASDSSEVTHLFYSQIDPLQDRRFQNVLRTFRTHPPAQQHATMGQRMAG